MLLRSLHSNEQFAVWTKIRSRQEEQNRLL